jgi:hypothetical protein
MDKSVANGQEAIGSTEWKTLKLHGSVVRSATGKCASTNSIPDFINNLDSDVRMIEIVKKFSDDTKIGKIVRSEEDRLSLQ